METTQDTDKLIQELRERVKAFEEDRYCPDGCIEYQLEKIELYKQYFGEINESITLLLSMLDLRPELKDTQFHRELEKMQLICLTAVDGSKWL